MDADPSETAACDVLTTNAEGSQDIAPGPKIALVHAMPPSQRRKVNISSVALSILAAVAFIFALQWAREFFIPLIFGILISYTLNPMIVWLERIKVPRAVGVGVVMLGLLATTVVVATSVYREAQAIMDETPMAIYKLSSAIKRTSDGKLGTLDRLHSMTDALKKAASSATDTTVDTEEKSKLRGKSQVASTVVAAKPPGFNLNDWLWAGSLRALGLVGQLLMVLFLVFFALLSGDTFKRKLVKLTGPTLTNKKITVHILDDINTSIQRYMFMLFVMNISLALITWLALHWIGLDNPGAWAVAAGLLHVIPYFGPLITAVAIGFAAFLQFESFSMMFLVFGVSLVISAVVGMLMTTWMTGRIAKMNATAVFIALLFGGWLWGVWGMLLCVPLIVVIKVISEHIEGMQPIAELLGE
ncbi:AI-2E family transporter [Paralcaligenes ureilyticus]|uniref:Putative PurR-regulated permease PerM n=1 Tax=Paralcaligenes ureilyticus TaxID=627131 RepID=A0A4R3MF28_9BURK|nr:AI-2E family transporter [Paralcaligenes ureilyticus]TCT10185.1 putative PurR-regulated permease PerM [Paralcaligenes ureilyticus]